MPVDQRLSDGKSEPRAVAAGRDHRVENLFTQVLIDTRAVVDYLSAGHQPVPPAANIELEPYTGSQRDFAFATQSLYSVAHDIQNGLYKKIRVSLKFGQTGVIILGDFQSALYLNHYQITHPFKDMVDIHSLHAGYVLRPQHTIDEVL